MDEYTNEINKCGNNNDIMFKGKKVFRYKKLLV